MGQPSQGECRALLELLLALGGPLLWTGPIPYDAIAARRSVEQQGDAAKTTPLPADPPAPRRRRQTQAHRSRAA